MLDNWVAQSSPAQLLKCLATQLSCLPSHPPRLLRLLLLMLNICLSLQENQAQASTQSRDEKRQRTEEQAESLEEYPDPLSLDNPLWDALHGYNKELRRVNYDYQQVSN